MVTEEIALNDALAAAGVSVLETDLGEYILQLAQEPPSHIVAPAVHKSGGKLAELFFESAQQTAAHRHPGDDARSAEQLRERF